MQGKDTKEFESKESKSLTFEQQESGLVQRQKDTEEALEFFLLEKLPIPVGSTQEAASAILLKRKNIMDILNINHGTPTYKEKCEKLKDLYEGIPASGLLGKIWDKSTGTPREQIKANLKDSNPSLPFKKMDPLMMNYVKAQNEVLVKAAAYRYAVQQADDIQRMKEIYPGAQIDIVVLKRHEICTNLHKASFDTDLDAFSTGFKGNQSKFELQTTQEVQTQRVIYLKDMGLIGHVKTFVSPVTRAHRTHENATLKPEVIDEVEFNADFAEKSSWISGKATVSTAKLAKQYEKNIQKQPGKKPKISSKEELIWTESKTQFQERLGRAENHLFSDFKPAKGSNGQGSLLLVAGHGAMNRETVLYFEKKYGANFDGVDFIAAPEIALDFGSQHNLLVARAPNTGEVLGMRFTGITTHVGENQAPPSEKKMLEGLEKNIEKGHKVNKSLSAYCKLERNPDKLQAFIEKHSKILFENLDFITTFDTNTLEKAKFIVNALFQKEQNDVRGKRGTAFAFPETYDTLVSQIQHPGKDSGFDDFANAQTLKGLLEDAKTLSGAQRIVHLIEAISNIREKEMGPQAHQGLGQGAEEEAPPLSYHLGSGTGSSL